MVWLACHVGDRLRSPKLLALQSLQVECHQDGVQAQLDSFMAAIGWYL